MAKAVKSAAKVASKKVAAKAPVRKGTRSLSTAEAVRKLAKAKAAAPMTAKEVNKAVAAEQKSIDAAVKRATGAKAKIVEMIGKAGAKGISAAEIATALGWARAGATISRAIKLAGFPVAKVRDDKGVLRYSPKAGA